MFNSAAKILSWEEGAQAARAWQAEGQKIVFTNGCFDIVHLGHIDYLEKARNLGDRKMCIRDRCASRRTFVAH